MARSGLRVLLVRKDHADRTAGLDRKAGRLKRALLAVDRQCDDGVAILVQSVHEAAIGRAGHEARRLALRGHGLQKAQATGVAIDGEYRDAVVPAIRSVEKATASIDFG